MNSNIIKDTYFNELLKDNQMFNSLKKLENLIGLKNTKQTLIEIINYLKLQKTKNKVPMLHMFFLGNPGTGKTTVARIFGEILSSLKILSNKEIFVEVTRADLIGRHIGETEEKTMKMIEKASGGILFIDEAYSLYSDKYSRDYGQNVVEMRNIAEQLKIIQANRIMKKSNFVNINEIVLEDIDVLIKRNANKYKIEEKRGIGFL